MEDEALTPDEIANSLRMDHEAILRRLSRVRRRDWAWETAPEISQALRWPRERAQPLLKAMEKGGLTEKGGVGDRGVRTWTITPAGEAVVLACDRRRTTDPGA